MAVLMKDPSMPKRFESPTLNDIDRELDNVRTLMMQNRNCDRSYLRDLLKYVDDHERTTKPLPQGGPPPKQAPGKFTEPTPRDEPEERTRLPPIKNA